MRLSLQEITQKGFISNHILIPATIAIVGVGGIGAYVLSKSSAATAHCAVSGKVLFYIDATSAPNCTSKTAYPYEASAQYGPYFRNFSSITYNKNGLTINWLDKLSAVDNNTSRRVCIYNNSKLMLSIPPYSFKQYIGDAYNDRADYYRIPSSSTASCPSS